MDQPDQPDQPEPRWNETLDRPAADSTSHLVWLVVDGALVVVIIGGNVLTICALKISRKLSAVMSNHFICSLAFSDLFVGLMLPYHLAFQLTEILGRNKYTCLLRFTMIMLASCASIYNLLAIAADRYVAIVYPLHYNRFMTKRVTGAIIFAGWMSAVSISTCPLYWNLYDGRAPCTLQDVLPAHYVWFVLTPTFASIWVSVLLLYVRIWREARGHTRRLRTNSYSNGLPPNDRKSVQVVLLILGCFSVCWLPYFVVMVTIKAFKFDTGFLYEATFTLAMANSGINPAIYTWKNAGFRAAFLKLLQCRTPNVGDNLCRRPRDGGCPANGTCVLDAERRAKVREEYSIANHDSGKGIFTVRVDE